MIHTRFRAMSYLLLLLLLLQLSPSAEVQARSYAADVDIYVDSLVSPWEDYSFSSTVDLDSSTHHAGSKGIAVTHSADGALSVHTTTALTGADYRSISFWAYGAVGGSSILLSIGDDPATKDPITIPAQTWTHFDVLLSALGSPATIERFNWQDATNAAQPPYYLDDIRVVAATASTGFPDANADGSRTIEPGPSGVAVAPSGRVYVASYHADIVYSWASVANMISTDVGVNAPDKVFGDSQTGDPDSDTGCTKAASSTILCGPESIAVDSQSNLFVADTYHHRILVFLNPDTNGSPLEADAVLGQANFTDAAPDHGNGDTVKEGLCYVRGLAVDVDDHLWAVDEFNFRAIRFDTPLVSSSLPSKVFGQPDLGTTPATCDSNASGGTGAAQFGLPLGVAVDQQGTLYVTDYNNNRVQRFAASAANGAEAEASYTSANGLDHAHDVAADASGNLYVANTYNDEVLIFEGGPSGDLTSDHTFPGRNFPMGMAFTAKGDLLVTDCGAAATGVDGDYPPCVKGTRGVFFFAAPAAPTFLPPNAVDDSASTLKDTAVSGNVLSNDDDPQASPLKVDSSTTPQHGTATVDPNGDFTYTPNNGYLGTDYFTYTVSNGHNLKDTATVTIQVTSVKSPAQPPVAVADHFQTTMNTTVHGNVLTNDRDPAQSPLTVVSSIPSDNGATQVAANGAFTFTPDSDYLGQTLFFYTIRNSSNLIATTSVTIKVVEAEEKSKTFLPALKHSGIPNMTTEGGGERE